MYVASAGVSLCPDASAVLQASIRQKKTKTKTKQSSRSRRSSRWFKSRKIILEDMCRPEGEWEDNNARKAQNIDQSMTTAGVAKESKDAWGRKRKLIVSVHSCLQPVTSLFYSESDIHPNVLLSSDVIKSWSSWAVIGRWHPAGSWRPLRGHEQPLACVSCSPFVNCTGHTEQIKRNVTSA